MERIFPGIVRLATLRECDPRFPAGSIETFVGYHTSPLGLLAAAGFLWPAMVEVDGSVFREEGLTVDRRSFDSDCRAMPKRELERKYNLFTFFDFFVKESDDQETITTIYSGETSQLAPLAEATAGFWNKKLSVDFPNRHFEFEVSIDGLLSEDGVCLTFWEAD